MAELRLTASGRNQELVLAYLQENASDVLAEKINNGTKTMAGCWDFITKEARKMATNNCAAVDDATVYGWAIHYFEEDDIEEAIAAAAKERQKIKAAEEEKKRKEREEAEKKLAAEAEAARIRKEQEKAAAEAKKAAEKAEKERKKAEAATGAVAGQTTLFDFFNLEE